MFVAVNSAEQNNNPNVKDVSASDFTALFDTPIVMHDTHIELVSAVLRRDAKISVIAGQNSLVARIGEVSTSNQFEVTIPPGNYTPDELATELKDSLNDQTPIPTYRTWNVTQSNGTITITHSGIQARPGENAGSVIKSFTQPINMNDLNPADQPVMPFTVQLKGSTAVEAKGPLIYSPITDLPDSPFLIRDVPTNSDGRPFDIMSLNDTYMTVDNCSLHNNRGEMKMTVTSSKCFYETSMLDNIASTTSDTKFYKIYFGNGCPLGVKIFGKQNFPGFDLYETGNCEIFRVAQIESTPLIDTPGAHKSYIFASQNTAVTKNPSAVFASPRFFRVTINPLGILRFNLTELKPDNSTPPNFRPLNIVTDEFVDFVANPEYVDREYVNSDSGGAGGGGGAGNVPTPINRYEFATSGTSLSGSTITFSDATTASVINLANQPDTTNVILNDTTGVQLLNAAGQSASIGTSLQMQTITGGLILTDGSKLSFETYMRGIEASGGNGYTDNIFSFYNANGTSQGIALHFDGIGSIGRIALSLEGFGGVGFSSFFITPPGYQNDDPTLERTPSMASFKHIVVTIDTTQASGQQVRVYVDGVQAAPTAFLNIAQNTVFSGIDLVPFVTRRKTGGGPTISARGNTQVKYVRAYDGVLTQTQITSLFTNRELAGLPQVPTDPLKLGRFEAAVAHGTDKRDRSVMHVNTTPLIVGIGSQSLPTTLNNANIKYKIDSIGYLNFHGENPHQPSPTDVQNNNFKRRPARYQVTEVEAGVGKLLGFQLLDAGEGYDLNASDLVLKFDDPSTVRKQDSALVLTDAASLTLLPGGSTNVGFDFITQTNGKSGFQMEHGTGYFASACGVISEKDTRSAGCDTGFPTIHDYRNERTVAANADLFISVRPRVLVGGVGSPFSVSITQTIRRSNTNVNDKVMDLILDDAQPHNWQTAFSWGGSATVPANWSTFTNGQAIRVSLKMDDMYNYEVRCAHDDGSGNFVEEAILARTGYVIDGNSVLQTTRDQLLPMIPIFKIPPFSLDLSNTQGSVECEIDGRFAPIDNTHPQPLPGFSLDDFSYPLTYDFIGTKAPLLPLSSTPVANYDNPRIMLKTKPLSDTQVVANPASTGQVTTDDFIPRDTAQLGFAANLHSAYFIAGGAGVGVRSFAGIGAAANSPFMGSYSIEIPSIPGAKGYIGKAYDLSGNRVGIGQEAPILHIVPADNNVTTTNGNIHVFDYKAPFPMPVHVKLDTESYFQSLSFRLRNIENGELVNDLRHPTQLIFRVINKEKNNDDK